MKFKFIDYQEDLFERVVDNDSPKLYIFDNFQNLLKAQEYYQQPFLQSASHFISMQDLKEKLCPTDKLILKEEKRSLLFYDLLRKREKEELRIDNYFDSIDLANAFFKFYDELEEYCIEELKNLKDWQEKKYRILNTIRSRYIKRLNELNYSDKTIAFDLKNYNNRFLASFQEIIFVNIIKFTPKEKDLISKIEESEKKISFYLQMDKEDFNHETLSLETLKFPEKISSKVELYHTEDRLLELIDMIKQIEVIQNQDQDIELNYRKTYTILDADFMNSTYHYLLSPNKISFDKEIYFTESKIYRFLNSLYEILLSSDEKGKLKIETNSLIQAVYQTEFRDYFNLKEKDIDFLHTIASDEYVYLTLEHIEYSINKMKLDIKSLRKYSTIFEMLRKINQLNSLKDFANFFEKINLKILNDDIYSNNISQYFDALLELSTIEDLSLFNSWNKYFTNNSRGLFRLFLNYLRYKKLNIIDEKEKASPVIKDLITSVHSRDDDLIILNAFQGALPGQKNSEFLLTDKQRREHGLRTVNDKNLEDKYYFIRHILSSRKAIIYSIKNIEENISSSPFLEELMLNYGLESKELKLKVEDYPTIISKIFKNDQKLFNRGLKDSPQSDKLMIIPEDFKENYSLSFYKYKVLKDCYYKFYLDHIARLEEERTVIEKELGARILGIIIHDIFAEVLSNVDIINTSLKSSSIDKFVERCFSRYYLRINNYYRKYYENIMLTAIKESLSFFIKRISKIVNEDILALRTEWVPEDKDDRTFYKHSFEEDGEFQNSKEISPKSIKFYLNGRVDLLIETREKKYIIDFKTGSGSDDQLDFYSLLLNQEEDEKNLIEKSIYNVLEQNFEKGESGTELEFKEKLEESLSLFLEGKEYSFEYKSRCKRCVMSEICRVV
ncbi:PD-(D/E)XK nuclease family protein [Natronospora cellulosivora (SeqCode)]